MGTGTLGRTDVGPLGISPLIGLLICLVFVAAMVRFMGGRGFMCMGDMGDHRSHASDEETEFRREIRELREELKQLKETR